LRLLRRSVGAAAVLFLVALPSAPSVSEAAVLPRVTPLVECKIVATPADPFDVYWFGYRSDGTYWRQPGANNQIIETTAGGAPVAGATNRGQVVQFKPGERTRSFAVRVAPGNVPRWAVTVAVSIIEGTNPQATAVATPNPGTPLCPIGVRRHSATVNVSAEPTIGFAAMGRRLDANGKLVASSIRFTIGNMTSACSAGGTPLPPQILWGYSSRLGTAPIRPSSVVRTDILTSTFQNTSFEVPFVRTWKDRLSIADPQEPSTNNLGETFYGVSGAGVIADVYGRCNVGGRVIKATEPLWVGITGFETVFYWYTNAAQQTVITPCVPSGLDVIGCPFRGGSSGGGGAFAKR
jgi:hypothetical protein